MRQKKRMFPTHDNHPVSFLCLACIAIILYPMHGWADTASDVRAFTGAPTRMVWIQDAGPTACVFSEKPTIRLMGFDTEDGKGERAILPDIGWYAKPLLTADGKRVVFSNLADNTIDVVNFDGTGLRQVVQNVSCFEDNATWTNPKTGVVWVYAQTMEPRGGQQVPVIRRYQLDNPKVNELVWDKTPVFMFMPSGDGRVASGGIANLGASSQGLFTLPNGSYLPRHNGCWPSMSPDASHRMWVFQGNHRAILLFTPTNRTGSVSQLGILFPAPGLALNAGDETYHPRWTNNVHFLAMDGPIPHRAWSLKPAAKTPDDATAKAPIFKPFGRDSDPKIPQDVAANVEIYLGRFKDDFSGVEQWIQVTNSKGGNYWSNVWIKPTQADLDALAAAIKAPQEEIPVAPSPKGLVYTWLNGGAGNQITDPATGALRQCNGQLKGEARYGLGYVMDLTGGSFVPDDGSGSLLTACKASNQFALEADITPTGAPTADEKVIIAFSDDLTKGNFVLAQQGDQLILSLKTDGAGSSTQPIRVAVLVRNQHNHVIISYAEGRLGCFINGQEAIIPNPLRGGLSNWTAQPLIFGDAAGGDTIGPASWKTSTFSIAKSSRRKQGRDISRSETEPGRALPLK